jgi:PIN domain nuclease of toxin-antitoxin system
MRLLLDTQVFIWWDSEPQKLSPRIRAQCENPGNFLSLSIASVWEMQIKLQLGKLDLDRPLADIIEDHRERNFLALLPIDLPHVLALQDLPPHHKDPFDRLIIAQARTEQLTIVSADAIFSHYPVNVLNS